MEAMIDQNTAAIIVNSPSNPCGSVFSVQHMKDILAIAEKYKVPIIADEIYEHFVFPGETYVPIASLTTTVPVLSCSGLTKRFLVPGWRLGWIVIYDRGHVFDHEVRKGLLCMSQRIIGSNTLVQGALPTILANTPKSFFDDTINVILNNAKLAFTKLRGSPHHPGQHSQVLLRRHDQRDPEQRQAGLHQAEGLSPPSWPTLPSPSSTTRST